jgi:hypothetical protein
MRGITKENKSGTAPACPEQSLFKYALSYNRPIEAGMPRVQYSMDAFHERGLFYRGLKDSKRSMWMQFIESFDGDAYSLFADCYPNFTEDGVVLDFSNTPSTIDFIKSLTNNERQMMQEIANKCGFSIKTFHPIAYNGKSVKPDLTPMHYKELNKLNGLNAVRKWLEKSFLHKGLTQIIVYDNLAYHQKNVVTKWDYIPEPARATSPAPAEIPRRVNVENSIDNFEKRHEQPVSLNSLIPTHFQTR